MAGTKTSDLAPRYSDLINGLVAETGIEETILVGHSAGGTSAVRVGSQIERSCAVSVNGQFAAEYYFPWTVNQLWQRAFPELESAAAMLDMFRDRLHLAACLASRPASSKFAWFSHANDDSSFRERPSLPAMANEFGLDPEVGGRTAHGDAVLVGEWEAPASAHALPGTVLPFIEAVLGESVTPFDLKIRNGFEPLWQR